MFDYYDLGEDEDFVTTNDEPLKSKQPTASKSPQWRNRAIEILVFVVLGVFGFAIVSSLLGKGPTPPAAEILPEIIPDNSGDTVGIYEAPSQRERDEYILSPIFSPSVQYWAVDILKWSIQAEIDPNLLATVMQIESCGWPGATSSVGAQGLFQVMPFHFEEGEDMTDPDTNAARGVAYLRQGLEISDGHAGLALAGYNGGHGLISSDYATWPNETQRYYRWGTGIYREASAGWETSPTLDDWLTSGGASLCQLAETTLNIR